MTLSRGTIQPHVNGDANGSTNGAAGKRLRIAVIPGDGIGTEVMVEGLRALRAAAKRWVTLLTYGESLGGYNTESSDLLLT
jgi:hypothetical protein